MHDIFITSAFRNDWNSEFNQKLTNALEIKGFKVFLSQRDAELLDASNLENRKKIFFDHIQAIGDCKLVLAIGRETRTANWGFELGYTYKNNKPIIVITDKEHPIELMPEISSTRTMVLDDLNAIPTYIDNLTSLIQECLTQHASTP